MPNNFPEREFCCERKHLQDCIKIVVMKAVNPKLTEMILVDLMAVQMRKGGTNIPAASMDRGKQQGKHLATNSL